MSALPFCLALVLPVSVVVGYMLGGIFTFLTPFVFFILLPLVDLTGMPDDVNPSAEDITELANRADFRLIAMGCALVQIGLVIWGGYAAAVESLSMVEFVGLVVSIGIVNGGMGITIAHELIHKNNHLEKKLGQALLLVAMYMHFDIEHRIGHHANVATAYDPSTARLGESIYKFYPRTVVQSFLNACQIESGRLKRHHMSTWGYHNQMIWFVLLPIVLSIGLGFGFGWMATLYFFIQALVGFSILETVNYVEHYGLERLELSPGSFSKVSAAHSWEANLKLTNYFFFKFQRHADHHLHAGRRYQVLCHHTESPQLPSGYAGMALLALIPPLWRKVMDPRVHAARQVAR